MIISSILFLASIMQLRSNISCNEWTITKDGCEIIILLIMRIMKIKMLMSQLGKGSLRIVYLIVHLYGNPFETSISLLCLKMILNLLKMRRLISQTTFNVYANIVWWYLNDIREGCNINDGPFHHVNFFKFYVSS